ncbi:MAG TPA: PEGA domain-containing protein [Candidatus Acidoferrales bacterium]|nr:PEGA domain-containing protein [Candidatus Acidoferrales bacterium]
MQPSRQHCLWASLVLLAFLLPATQARANTLTITSTPSGATVEIDGVVVGKTPYRTNFPGGYFHKTHTVFGSRLDHAMILRVSMDGYGTEQINMTDGPYAWTALTGRREGTYFLLKSDRFDVNLAAAYEPSRHVAGAYGHVGPMPAAPQDSSDAEDQDAAETGNVLVTSETEGAEIYADGHFVGQTPSTIKLTKGTHRIEVRAPGQKPWVRSLDVLKGNRVTLHAKFPESDGAGGSANDNGDTTKPRD